MDSLPCAPIDLFVFFLTIKQTLPTLLISQIVFANLSIQASWKSNCSFAIWDHRSKESHDSDIPSGVLSGGESKEVGVDGLQAQAAHRSQCDAEEWNAVADDGQSVDLMFKTVADPIFYSLPSFGLTPMHPVPLIFGGLEPRALAPECRSIRPYGRHRNETQSSRRHAVQTTRSMTHQRVSGHWGRGVPW